MKYWMPFVGSALALLWAAGCVVSSGTSTATTSGTTAAAPAKGTAPVMEINDQQVYAADLLSSPIIRGFLRQYVFYVAIDQEAARRGVTVDPVKLEERIDAVMLSVYDNGEDWELYLAEQSITEDEFRESVHSSLLFDALVEDQVDLSDAKLLELWEAERTQVIDDYMRNNHYPDSMRNSVTFEDCRESLTEKILRRDGFPIMDELNKRLMRESKVKLLCMESAEDADKYEYLILEIINDQLRRQEEAAAATVEGAETSPLGQVQPSDSADSASESGVAEASGDDEETAADVVSTDGT